MSNIILAQKFIKNGNRDLKIATSELNTDSPVYDMVCFHLQQFVEKYLKAFLILMEVKPQKTHNLAFLLNSAINIDHSFSVFLDTNIIELSDCGVEVRYDEIEEVDSVFVENSLADLIKFREFVKTKLFNQAQLNFNDI